ncbi:hypothetical protein LCGC14_1158170 [marine sediment metagenome]|uniref:Uncharacterized protein n=1 Tax=marine sediment metagenome TaxID=412755 RepID=A0A0F9PYZ8_9ZZZZ
MAFANNLRLISTIIYRLKRQFGVTIIYYRVATQTQNVETGAIVRTYTTITIRRAAVLPDNMTRSFIYDLSFIAANNNFVGGGFFDKHARVLLIDAKDFPNGFIPNMDDHIEYDGQRYEVTGIQPAEQRRAYLFKVEEIESGEVVTP